MLKRRLRERGNEKLASKVPKPHVKLVKLVKLVKVVNSPNAEMALPAFQTATCKELKTPQANRDCESN